MRCTTGSPSPGKPDAEAVDLLRTRSPSAVGDRIKVPTLIVQGQTDSLFPLGQADAMAKAIRANGAPVDVDWIAGGHDGGDMESVARAGAGRGVVRPLPQGRGGRRYRPRFPRQPRAAASTPGTAPRL